jgi:hypothetical protein
MSRNNIKALEEEINFLRITIQHFNKENIEIKNQIEDLKITLNSDKRILQEYLIQISDKDSTVMKLNNTVEQLKKRLENLESQQIYTRKNNRMSTPGRDRTESTNTKTRQIGNITIKPSKEDQPRSLSVIKPRKIHGDLISNKIDIIKNNEKKKYKPGNKLSKIKHKQEKIKSDIIQIKHKLELIQHMYLRSIEKIKQGTKLTSVVLYDEKEDLKTKKLSQNDISLNDIFQKNFEQNKEKMILFMDDKNQVWEITPQPHLTEDILKQGNYQFLKSLETVKIYNNEYNTDNKNEKDSKDKNDDIDDDIEVTMNSSFYNEKYDENYNEYIRSDNFDILEESQDSNIANIERRLKG